MLLRSVVFDWPCIAFFEETADGIAKGYSTLLLGESEPFTLIGLITGGWFH